jgi:thioredoxin reductase
MFLMSSSSVAVPAGLTAALMLGRACKRVLVCDAGKPRNQVALAAHGFFSRDGISPAQLLQIGREQLQPYKDVEIQVGEVIDAQKLGDRFQVTLSDGKQFVSHKLRLCCKNWVRIENHCGKSLNYATTPKI